MESGKERGIDSLLGILRHSLRVILAPDHLWRTSMISLVVGTWLTLFNQYDVILAAEWTAQLFFKIFLNYLTPFVVANAGLISFQE